MYVICATCAIGLMASTSTGMITCASHPNPVAGSTLMLKVLCTQMLTAHRIMPTRKLGVEAPATESNTISDDPGPRAAPGGRHTKRKAHDDRRGHGKQQQTRAVAQCLAHQLEPRHVVLRPEVAGRMVNDVLRSLAQCLPGRLQWFYRKVLSSVLRQDQSP